MIPTSLGGKKVTLHWNGDEGYCGTYRVLDVQGDWLCISREGTENEEIRSWIPGRNISEITEIPE